MFTETITALRDLLFKIPTTLLSALAIVSILVLWMPTEYATTLGIEAIREDHRQYFGIGLLIVTAMLMARLLSWTAEQYKRHKQRKVNRNRLRTLTSDEKGYLSPFVLEEVSCLYLDPTDGIAGMLRRKGILYVTNNSFDILEGMPHAIQPWALRYLRSNLQLIEGAASRPMTSREKRQARRI